MAGKSDTGNDRPLPRRIRHGRIGLGMLSSLTLAAVILSFAAMSLSGRSVPAPPWMLARLENSISERLPEGRIGIGGAEMMIGRDGVPQVILKNVRIGDAAGGGVAELNALRTRLSPGALFSGSLAASSIILSGAQITLRRNADGSFALQAGAPTQGGLSFAAILESLDAALAVEPLSSIREILATGVVLSLEDARSGQIWQATNASLTLRRTNDGLSISLTSDVFNGTDDLASVQLSLNYTQATRATSIGVTLTDVPASDIAVQTPALAWLGVLDAPISGSVRASLDNAGGLSSLAGTLDIAGGVLRPTEATDPVSFDDARAYFSFDPSRQRIDFTEIAVSADKGRILASGHTYLSETTGGWPAAYLGQFVVSEAKFDGGGFFEGPVALSDVRADLRLRLAPFSVEIPQIALDNAGTPVRASGRVSAESDGWHVSVDARTESIQPKTVVEFWPTQVAPGTRDWLVDNVISGQLTDLSAAFRLAQGEKPEISLSFDYENGVVRFLKTLPPITGGHGRGALIDRMFTAVVDGGLVDAADGGSIDGTGTVFQISDVREKPAPGAIDIRARGPLEAALSILDNPPFSVMERAGRSPDLAKANATIAATVTLPLKKGIQTTDVDYKVDAHLDDLRSATLVPGRVVMSDRLEATVTPAGIRVFGPARLDGVPLTADWQQPFGADAASGGSTITGRIELSDATLNAFSIPLPSGMVSGSGHGDYSLKLARGVPPLLNLTSDLAGLRLALGSLGWSKGAEARGGFELTASLAEIPDVQKLSLSAPGLALDGSVDLGAGGKFLGANFDQLRVGDWLDASVRLTPRGNASPAVRITGGSFDLRRFSRLNRSSGDSGSPIDVALDSMVVTDNVTFAPVTGRLDPVGGALSGTFEARVNGRTNVRGTLAPSNGGTAVRLRANNAGGVIRDAGLTPNAVGGTLDLVLTPVVGAPDGTYDGEFLIENIRVRKAPAMADLLDAISVVGLIDQLDGPGLRFSSVDGRFRLSRNTFRLQEAAAVGGSLGISLDGLYDLNAKALDMQGVISPIYFVNGIGSILTRRGEGLFGFNFRVTGSASEPDVSVNPLSIFTPGMFRSIFRRSPPG